MDAKKLVKFFDCIIPAIEHAAKTQVVELAAENALQDARMARGKCAEADHRGALEFTIGEAASFVRRSWLSMTALADEYDGWIDGTAKEARYHARRRNVAAGREMLAEAKGMRPTLSSEIFRAQLELWGKAPMSVTDML